jgi:hypothetical protein
MRWNLKSYTHKFKNKAITDKGERFASKLEHRYKNHLELLKNAGEIVFYLTQVPIRLPGGTKYLVDFLVFYSDGTIKFVDTKGILTDSFKIKKREIEAIYPFEIEVIKKGDF